MKVRIFTVPTVLAVAITHSTLAAAEPILFSSVTSFFAAAPIESVQTFDSFPSGAGFGTPQIALGGVQYATSACIEGRCWTFDAFTAANRASEPNALISNEIATHTLGFGPGRHSNALGFFFVGGGAGPGFEGWTVAVRELDGSTTAFSITPATTETFVYFGLLSDVGIVDITVANRAGNASNSNWLYDNVARGAVLGGPPLPDSAPVPEPTTLLLVGSALAGIACRRRARCGAASISAPPSDYGG